MLTARIEGSAMLIDSSSLDQFARLAAEFRPVIVGLTGRYFDDVSSMAAGTDSWSAALPDVFAVGSAEGWLGGGLVRNSFIASRSVKRHPK